MSKFNWQLSTFEELAVHMKNSPEGSIRQQVVYYKAMNNPAMIEKIDKAKKLVQLLNLETLIDELKQEISLY